MEPYGKVYVLTAVEPFSALFQEQLHDIAELAEKLLL